MFLAPPLQTIIFAVLLRDVVFPEFVDNILVKLEYTLIPLVTMIDRYEA